MLRDIAHGRFDHRTFIIGVLIGIAIGVGLAAAGSPSFAELGSDFRILLLSVAMPVAVFFASWLARLIAVGRVTADVHDQLSAWTYWPIHALTSLMFGLFCVVAPLLVLLVTGVILGWQVAEVAEVFVRVTFLHVAFRALLGTVINLGLITHHGSRSRDI